MNPLAHLHIDFAAEPTGPGRFARRVAVALAALAALGIAAVIWLSAENRRAQEQLAALLARLRRPRRKTRASTRCASVCSTTGARSSSGSTALPRSTASASTPGMSPPRATCAPCCWTLTALST